MTVFLRLMADTDKETALADCCETLRAGGTDARVFDVAPEAFKAVPGAPFAYWANREILRLFVTFPSFEASGYSARQGLSTGSDFRFVRGLWECSLRQNWMGFAKGGIHSGYYNNIHLAVKWNRDGYEIKSFSETFYGELGSWSRNIRSAEHYGRPGLTWPRRTQGGLSFRVMPRGCIFADKGPAAFVSDDDPAALLALLALVNSQAFLHLVSMQMAFGSYEVGVIQRTPVPDLAPDQETTLAALARRAWSLKRTLDTVEETSHAFLLPAPLRPRLGDYNPPAITAALADIQAEIDALAFDLYGFGRDDRIAARAFAGPTADASHAHDTDDEPDDDTAPSVADTDALLSWAVGVAFGRFDLRLATGERAAPPEPDPFDPLPAKSPGMLPDGDPPFHAHDGILVDDPGHPHDLAHLIDRVLARVDMDGPDDTRAWLRRSFFPLHLRQYSKSRRKAPIYWPLSTASGDYTLWLYYPAVTDQTLFVAANDVVGAKLDRQVEPALRALRQKTDRSRAEERELEALDTLDAELRALRDELLRLAPTWEPNHDDGVQITAAPLWRLFRHRPWQTVLRDTWEKLEAGDYDWAHLAMTYWPDRVREKCRGDKSLAIAHDLEDLYEPPPEAPARGGRDRRRRG